MQMLISGPVSTPIWYALRTKAGPGISIENESGLRPIISRYWSTSRQAYKLDRLNVMGYYKILRKDNNMITDKEYKILMTDVYRKIITAVNIATGDDGSKAHEVLKNFHELWKMNPKQYEKQQKYFG
jgi:hypothetical protein